MAAVHYLEIVTDAPEAARDHYAAAYGWAFRATGPEWGGSFVAALPDGSMCGIRGPLADGEAPLVRAYLRVDDLGAAVAEAERLGAEVLLPSMPIADAGTIAIYRIGGVEQGLWQVP